MPRLLSLLTLSLIVAVAVPLGQSMTPQQAPATQGPPAGRGRGGVPVQGAEPDIVLVDRFDKDGNKRLDYLERTAAREYLAAHPELRRTVRPPAMTRRGTPGPRLAPNGVRVVQSAVSLYDASTLRTLFLQFERDD
ncbi:MAG TPA: hypothetical protein PKW63_02640, partial [Vicinamibacterales bacterium]|nr:hypothetical protein [Vicinamibacterales bacterium]